ncbi:MAG TPA: hypothetical protein PKA63_12585 [Oligoflexia bacterium]|nr:hypothetical protein [Oligoflexia bacterium]HMP49494.1 hypothetical protein [Oligoflexia bacterium]
MKREITLTKHKFGEDTESSQIQDWQELGVSAIWKASFEILEQWFIMRGLDPEQQRIDRSLIKKYKAPWVKGSELSFEEDL